MKIFVILFAFEGVTGMIKFNNKWDEILEDEFMKTYYKELRDFLKYEYSNYVIYPEMNNIFNAFKYTSYEDVKVMILGQDPYHGAGQAHGLAFSVGENVPLPPSLVNIYKEIYSDLGITPASKGTLTKWTKEGVMLLNTVLTVRDGQANSHKGKGWEIFTDRVIELLNEREKPIVFMLWGANARSKKKIITNPKHLILECAHPSPLSAYNGFFGCRHFSKANDFLRKTGQQEIDWDVK